MSIKDITIVITSFRSDIMIRNCLKSIDRQCKVILVENSNDLRLKNSIEIEFSNVECILTGANLRYTLGQTKYKKTLFPKWCLGYRTRQTQKIEESGELFTF